MSNLPLPNCLQTSTSGRCQHKCFNTLHPASSDKTSNVHERVMCTQVRQHCPTCFFRTVFRRPRAGDVDTSTSTTTVKFTRLKSDSTAKHTSKVCTDQIRLYCQAQQQSLRVSSPTLLPTTTAKFIRLRSDCILPRTTAKFMRLRFDSTTTHDNKVRAT